MTTKRVALSGARFLAGLTARVGGAEVTMDRVEVQRAAVLARATTGSVAPASPPRLLQLAGTDVASLTLTGVDLRACRFSGAINLDKLRIDGSPQLAVRQGWQAHRRVLAEEHVWRRVHGRWRRDSSLQQLVVVPEQVAPMLGSPSVSVEGRVGTLVCPSP